MPPAPRPPPSSARAAIRNRHACPPPMPPWSARSATARARRQRPRRSRARRPFGGSRRRPTAPPKPGAPPRRCRLWWCRPPSTRHPNWPPPPAGGNGPTRYRSRWRRSGPAESCPPYRPPLEIHIAVAVSWPQLVTSGNFFPRPHSPGEWLFVSEAISQKFHLSVKRITLLTAANGYPLLRTSLDRGRVQFPAEEGPFHGNATLSTAVDFAGDRADGNSRSDCLCRGSLTPSGSCVYFETTTP